MTIYNWMIKIFVGNKNKIKYKKLVHKKKLCFNLSNHLEIMNHKKK